MPRKPENDPPYPEQARRIKTVMAWNGLASAHELAQVFPWSTSTANNRMQGRHKLKPIEVRPLAEVFGVDPAYLADGGPDPFPSLEAALAKASADSASERRVVPSRRQSTADSGEAGPSDAAEQSET